MRCRVQTTNAEASIISGYEPVYRYLLLKRPRGLATPGGCTQGTTGPTTRSNVISLLVSSALACSRLLEIKTGDGHTAKSIMEQMENLNCVLSRQSDTSTPRVYIENPAELQAQVPAGLGYQIKDGWVLQISA